MKIDRTYNNGVLLLRLTGELNEAAREPLYLAIERTDSQGPMRVALDLGGVDFMNSSGLGILVQLTAQINMMEGRLMLVNLTSFVQGVLTQTNLTRFFDIATTSDEAIAKLSTM